MGKRAAKSAKAAVEVDKVEVKRAKRKKKTDQEESEKKDEKNEKKKEDPPLKFTAVTRSSFNALFGKPPVPLPDVEDDVVPAPVAAAAVTDSLEAICCAETQVASEDDLATPPPVLAKPVETVLDCPDSVGTSKGQTSSKSELFTEFTLKNICDRLRPIKSEDELSKVLDGILTKEIDADSFSVLLNECLDHPRLKAHIDKVIQDEGIEDGDGWKFGDGEGDQQEDVAAFIRWLVKEDGPIEPRSLNTSFQSAGDSAIQIQLNFVSLLSILIPMCVLDKEQYLLFTILFSGRVFILCFSQNMIRDMKYDVV